MSLNYDLTKVPEEHKKEGPPSSITTALIWATIPVGMNAITKENVKEFYFRLSITEHVFEPWLYESKASLEFHSDGVDEKPKPRYITYKEVYDRIGLSTNATNMSRGAFKALVMKRLMRENEDRVRNHMEKEGA